MRDGGGFLRRKENRKKKKERLVDVWREVKGLYAYCLDKRGSFHDNPVVSRWTRR